MTEEEFDSLADGSWKYEIEALRQRVDSYSNIIDNQIGVIQELQLRVAELEKDRDAWRDVAKEANREQWEMTTRINELATDWQVMHTKLAACEKELLIRDKKIQDLVAENTSLDDKLAASQQRISELEATIRQHGIPVKTYAGGEAHYVMGEPK